MFGTSKMGAANGHTRRSDILHLPRRNDRGNCRPRFGARGIDVDLGHVAARPFVPRKLPRPLMQSGLGSNHWRSNLGPKRSY
jgi:hypothetical protein